ncbi:carbonic anhydrase 7 [Bactrocera dorsalis]|uniref:Carbonic anhydrase 7 n=1 Tax=Bactrocera dorsalis TaxID=27457 RepID=A0A6I9V215_BACDO|nr:carbonic anhydrase 7 [Bactrocera dorsalis]XP_011201658.2 carbonic anhydrase 7 [Bactrocera dorsalis]XP_011201659.2 carbonic anhydrase 7 [Bactrocera dorsalis]XP_019845369.2 carbonic anhydrase 7 [Bactrocera dorsalis]XP_019845370.2 carbonic anhydrase 7 [Bactrocera dorsalis]XP_019845371.2 carbonic anhydrase 7 [Bactrocera dorsalis]XP_019845373.2 carbonic anhydrase 7 [Bactrocera dorsalis]XP_049315394.1 carbonic anhydrase 7 [Bactrocera dorsalis]XP_049315395.1 carbonic anhydrase 7 [Bactrocera dor
MQTYNLDAATLLALICCNVFGVTFANDFAYNGAMGPDHWGEQFSTCSGKHQSPINIDSVNVIRRTYPPLIAEHFGSQPISAEILNNGHTVVVRLEYAEERPTVWGGPLVGEFVFEQLHFHWGDNDTFGSEDRINNVSFPAELHMVFRNIKYPTFEEAAAKSNGVAVLAYFYKITRKDNPEYDEFTELLEHVVKPGTVAKFSNPPLLWDFSHIGIDDYYTYIGSLTTPPCSEDVNWIDFKEPVHISANQIERFRHLHTNDNSPMTHNYRPLQPLNDRTVYSSLTLREPKRRIKQPASDIPFVDNMVGGATMQKPFVVGVATIMLSLSLLVAV